jgi:hypothetical protein
MAGQVTDSFSAGPGHTSLMFVSFSENGWPI